MKSTELKAMIKEAVKEAIGEELKEILLEAVRAPKPNQTFYENRMGTPTTDVAAPISQEGGKEKLRENMMNILGRMTPGQDTISMNSSHAQGFGHQPGYAPPASANTTGQGSALPPGEVNMDQIMGLINKK